MNLYEELYKVKEAQVDALKIHISDLEMSINDLERSLKVMAQWIESIHGQETMKQIIQDLRKFQKASLAKKNSEASRFS